MWKLFAVGLSVLQIAQAIPYHPGFFYHRDSYIYRLSSEELDHEASVSSNSKLISNTTATTVVYPETVTVCDHIICMH